MEPTELQRSMDEVQVLDVRDDDEWTAGHIDGARHVPMDEVQDRLGDLSTGSRIVTVCRSGQRSGKVAEDLRSRGYDAENLEGGLHAWHEAGLTLVAADGSAGAVA
jgi:rhodanese-related sulfurtransferase